VRTYITRHQYMALLRRLVTTPVWRTAEGLADAWMDEAGIEVSSSEDPYRIALHELIQMTMQMGVYDALAYCPDDLRAAYAFAKEAPETVLRAICERAADRLSDNAIASAARWAVLDRAVEEAGYPTDRADGEEVEL
jgi:hypothetical protein